MPWSRGTPAQNGSAVTRYNPADGSVTVLSTGVGFFITGAGVNFDGGASAVI